MPLLCAFNSIKYTVVIIPKDDLNEIMESAVVHGIDNRIYGFISDNTLWIDGANCIDDHWSDEIIAEYPDSYMIIINGSPQSVDEILGTYIVMEQDWYNQHTMYDLWQTSVGYIAVC